MARRVFALILALLALGSAYLFYTRYWHYRDCIAASLSSCITPEGDTLTGGGMFWALFAVLFAITAIVAARR